MRDFLNFDSIIVMHKQVTQEERERDEMTRWDCQGDVLKLCHLINAIPLGEAELKGSLGFSMNKRSLEENIFQTNRRDSIMNNPRAPLSSTIPKISFNVVVGGIDHWIILKDIFMSWRRFEWVYWIVYSRNLTN